MLGVVTKLIQVPFVFLIILLNSCTEPNGDKFLFHFGKETMTVKSYEIYENDLGNLFLVIKDAHQRNWIVNNPVELMEYVSGEEIHKACNVKITHKPVCDFNLEITNDGKRCFVSGFNEYKQEMLYLGQKEKLKFITDNNKLIFKER